MTTENVQDLLKVFDTSRQHLENLIKILDSPDRNDGHEIANQILKIDLNLTEIQKRVDKLRKGFHDLQLSFRSRHHKGILPQDFCGNN